MDCNEMIENATEVHGNGGLSQRYVKTVTKNEVKLQSECN